LKLLGGQGGGERGTRDIYVGESKYDITGESHLLPILGKKIAKGVWR